MSKQYIYISQDDIPYIVVNVENCNVYYNRNGNKKTKEESKEGEKKLNSSVIERTSLKEAANYIVNLYDLLNDKFEASPVKVQKLLFIANLTAYYCYGNSFLPNDTEYECNKCGFKIPKVLNEIRNFISAGVIENKKLDLSDYESDALYKTLDSNLTFSENNTLCYNVRKVLLHTFLTFGSYDPVDLGTILNDFKNSPNDDFFKQEPPFLFHEEQFPILIKTVETISNNEIKQFMEYYKDKFKG